MEVGTERLQTALSTVWTLFQPRVAILTGLALALILSLRVFVHIKRVISNARRYVVSARVHVSLKAGVVELSKLSLKPGALSWLSLPLDCTGASVETARLWLPWSARRCLRFEATCVRLHASTRSMPPLQRWRSFSAAQHAKQLRCRAKALQAVDAVLWGPESPPVEQQQQGRWQRRWRWWQLLGWWRALVRRCCRAPLARCCAAVLRGMEVSIRDTELFLRQQQQQRWQQQQQQYTPQSAAMSQLPAEQPQQQWGGSTLRASLGTLLLASSGGACATLQLRGLQLSLLPGHGRGNGGGSAPTPPQTSERPHTAVQPSMQATAHPMPAGSSMRPTLGPHKVMEGLRARSASLPMPGQQQQPALHHQQQQREEEAASGTWHDAPPPPPPPLPSPSQQQTGQPISILKRWHISAKIVWPSHTPATSSTCGSHSHVPQQRRVGLQQQQLDADDQEDDWYESELRQGGVSVTVQASPFVLHADLRALEFLAGLISCCCEYTTYHETRMTRPQVDVCCAPQLWWRHAIRQVMRHRRALLHGGNGGSRRVSGAPGGSAAGVGALNSPGQRAEYRRLYIKHRELLAGPTILLPWRWLRRKLLLSSLQRFESEGVDTHLLARQRWWAWVHHDPRNYAQHQHQRHVLLPTISPRAADGHTHTNGSGGGHRSGGPGIGLQEGQGGFGDPSAATGAAATASNASAPHAAALGRSAAWRRLRTIERVLSGSHTGCAAMALTGAGNSSSSAAAAAAAAWLLPSPAAGPAGAAAVAAAAVVVHLRVSMSLARLVMVDGGPGAAVLQADMQHLGCWYTFPALSGLPEGQRPASRSPCIAEVWVRSLRVTCPGVVVWRPSHHAHLDQQQQQQQQQQQHNHHPYPEARENRTSSSTWPGRAPGGELHLPPQALQQLLLDSPCSSRPGQQHWQSQAQPQQQVAVNQPVPPFLRVRLVRRDAGNDVTAAAAEACHHHVADLDVQVAPTDVYLCAATARLLAGVVAAASARCRAAAASTGKQGPRQLVAQSLENWHGLCASAGGDGGRGGVGNTDENAQQLHVSCPLLRLALPHPELRASLPLTASMMAAGGGTAAASPATPALPWDIVAVEVHNALLLWRPAAFASDESLPNSPAAGPARSSASASGGVDESSSLPGAAVSTMGNGDGAEVRVQGMLQARLLALDNGRSAGSAAAAAHRGGGNSFVLLQPVHTSVRVTPATLHCPVVAVALSSGEVTVDISPQSWAFLGQVALDLADPPQASHQPGSFSGAATRLSSSGMASAPSAPSVPGMQGAVPWQQQQQHAYPPQTHQQQYLEQHQYHQHQQQLLALAERWPSFTSSAQSLVAPTCEVSGTALRADLDIPKLHIRLRGQRAATREAAETAAASSSSTTSAGTGRPPPPPQPQPAFTGSNGDGPGGDRSEWEHDVVLFEGSISRLNAWLAMHGAEQSIRFCIGGVSLRDQSGGQEGGGCALLSTPPVLVNRGFAGPHALLRQVLRAWRRAAAQSAYRSGSRAAGAGAGGGHGSHRHAHQQHLNQQRQQQQPMELGSQFSGSMLRGADSCVVELDGSVVAGCLDIEAGKRLVAYAGLLAVPTPPRRRSDHGPTEAPGHRGEPGGRADQSGRGSGAGDVASVSLGGGGGRSSLGSDSNLASPQQTLDAFGTAHGSGNSVLLPDDNDFISPFFCSAYGDSSDDGRPISPAMRQQPQQPAQRRGGGVSNPPAMRQQPQQPGSERNGGGTGMAVVGGGGGGRQRTISVQLRVQCIKFGAVLYGRPVGAAVLGGLQAGGLMQPGNGGSGSGSTAAFATLSELQVVDELAASPRYRYVVDTIAASGPLVPLPCVRVAYVQGSINHTKPSRRPPSLDSLSTGSSAPAASLPPADMGRRSQSVLLLTCRRLHVHLLGRYMHDLLHMLSDQCAGPWQELAAAPGGGAASSSAPHTAGGGQQQQQAQQAQQQPRYSSLLSLSLHDCWVDVPRHSWSDDLFRVVLGRGRAMWPASPRFLARLQERVSSIATGVAGGAGMFDGCPELFAGDDASDPVGPLLDLLSAQHRAARYAIIEAHDPFYAAEALRRPPASPASAVGRGSGSSAAIASPGSLLGVLGADLFAPFEHWHEETGRGMLVVALRSPDVHWASYGDRQSMCCKRRMLTGSDALLHSTAHSGTRVVQVHWPVVRGVLGGLQYETLMGVIWENMGEPCSFKAASWAAARGKITPRGSVQTPASSMLVHDRSCSSLLTWVMEMDVDRLDAAVEQLPPPPQQQQQQHVPTASGPPLGQVVVRSGFVRFGRYANGALKVLVGSGALDIFDTRGCASHSDIDAGGGVSGGSSTGPTRGGARHSSGSGDGGVSINVSGGVHPPPLVLHVGCDQSLSAWAQLADEVQLQRLPFLGGGGAGGGSRGLGAAAATFSEGAYATSPAGAGHGAASAAGHGGVAWPHLSTSSFDSGTGTGSGQGGGGVAPGTLPQQPVEPLLLSASRKLAEPDKQVNGWLVEYVIHQQPWLLPGRHVMEVVLRGAELRWPYLMCLDLVHAITALFSNYFWAPSCAPPPPRGSEINPSAATWLFTKTVFVDSTALLPLTRWAVWDSPPGGGGSGGTPPQRLRPQMPAAGEGMHRRQQGQAREQDRRGEGGGEAEYALTLAVPQLHVSYDLGGGEYRLQVTGFEVSSQFVDVSTPMTPRGLSAAASTHTRSFATSAWDDAHGNGGGGGHGAPRPTDFMAPFFADVVIVWTVPQVWSDGNCRTTNVTVTCGELQVQPCFSHLPALRVSLNLLASELARNAVPSPGQLDDSSLAWANGGPPPRPMASLLQVDIRSVDSVSVVLVDDRYGIGIGQPVLQALIKPLSMAYEVKHVLSHQLSIVEAAALAPAAASGGGGGGGPSTQPLTPMPVLQRTAHANVTAALQVLFLNSAMDSVDPLLEHWPVTITLTEAGASRVLLLQSSDKMRLVLTPLVLRSVGDAMSFAAQLLAKHTPRSFQRSNRMMRSGGSRWMGAVRGTRPETMYSLVNRCGSRVQYWSGDLAGPPISLEPGEASAMEVEPVEKTVFLPETQHQVQVKTICLRVGTSEALTAVVVSRVGKYAYRLYRAQGGDDGGNGGGVMDSGGQAGSTLVVEVDMEVRTKVVTLRSLYLLENATSLDLGVHMQYSDQQLRKTVSWSGSLPGRPAGQLLLPPLLPGAAASSSSSAGLTALGLSSQQFGLPLHLPLAVVRAGVSEGTSLGLRVEGCRWAANSLGLVDLGLEENCPLMYSCPPPEKDGGGGGGGGGGSSSVHIALQVIRTSIKVCNPRRAEFGAECGGGGGGGGGGSGGRGEQDKRMDKMSSARLGRPTAHDSFVDEVCLLLHPPLRLTNALPYDMDVDVTDGQISESLTLPLGSSVDLFQFDFCRKVRMSVKRLAVRMGPGVKVYRSSHALVVYYPRNLRNDMVEAGRRLKQGVMPSLSPPEHIQLVDSQASAAATSRHTLLLQLQNKVNPYSDAREVIVYCPFWVLNKTGLQLRLRQGKSSSIVSHSNLAAGSVSPVLVDGTSSMRMSAHTYWSKPITLEALGGQGTTYVLAHAGRGRAAFGTQAVRVDQPVPVDSRRSNGCEEISRNSLGGVAAAGGIGASTTTGAAGATTGSGSSSSRMPFAAPARASSTRGSLDDSGAKDSAHFVMSEESMAYMNCFGGSSGGGFIGLGSGAAKQGSRPRRLDFSLQATMGPGVFARTKVVTLAPRYLVENRLPAGEVLQYGQRGANVSWQLQPGQRAPFFWDDATVRFNNRYQMCVRPAEGGWLWSGAFHIDETGDFGLRVFQPRTRTNRVLPVEVSMVEATVLITVGNPNKTAPYRIENRCKDVSVQYKQKDPESGVGSGFDLLPPLSSADYAWDEPTGSHKMWVRLTSSGGQFVDMSTHEYNLDDLRACPAITLRRFKLGGAKPHGLLAALPLRVRHNSYKPGGSAGSGGGSSGGGGSERRAGGQPQAEDPFEKVVYVGVYAKGPTRVLVFSSMPNEYTQDAGEESVEALEGQLRSLERRLRGVESELAALGSDQDIDVAQAIDADPVLKALAQPAVIHLAQQQPLAPHKPHDGEDGGGGEGSASGAGAGQDPASGGGQGEGSRHAVRARLRNTMESLKQAAVCGAPRIGDESDIEEEEGEGANAMGGGKAGDGGRASRGGGGFGAALPRRPMVDRAQLLRVAVESGADLGLGEGWDGADGGHDSNDGGGGGGQYMQRTLLGGGGGGDIGGGDAQQALKASKSLLRPHKASASGIDNFSEASVGTASSKGHVLPNVREEGEAAQPSEALCHQQQQQRGEIDSADGLPPPPPSMWRDVSGSEANAAGASMLLTTGLATMAEEEPDGVGDDGEAALSIASLARDSASSSMPRGLSSNLAVAAGGVGAGGGVAASTSSIANGGGGAGNNDPLLCQRSQLVSADGSAIMGGELVVKVMEVENLRLKEVDTGLRRPSRMRRMMRSLSSKLNTPLELYCQLRCEGEVQATRVVGAGPVVTWGEEKVFKSVPASGELQVTVMGQTAIGEQLRLGTAFIALEEVEDTGDMAGGVGGGAGGPGGGMMQGPGQRTFLLETPGREVATAAAPPASSIGAITAVPGSIAARAGSIPGSFALVDADELQQQQEEEEAPAAIKLQIYWRLSPLSVLTLKVRAMETEVANKEEMLALIMERFMPDGGLDMMSVAAGAHVVMQGGSLEVQVKEAVLTGGPGFAQSIDAFVRVERSGTVGTHDAEWHETPTRRASKAPVWDSTLHFPKALLGDRLTVQLLDRKIIGAHSLVGQARLPLLPLGDGRPHYLWLSLRGRLNTRELARVRLRLHWVSHDAAGSQAADEALATTVEVKLDGLSCSLVEVGVMQLPRELVNVTLTGLHFYHRNTAPDTAGIGRGSDSDSDDEAGSKRSRRRQGGGGRVGGGRSLTTRKGSSSARLAVQSMQIDNQLLSSDQPVVLCRSHHSRLDDMANTAASLLQRHGITSTATAGGAADRSLGDYSAGGRQKPFVEVGWEMVQHNPSIMYFRYFDLLLQEVDFVVEEEFLDALALFMRTLPLAEVRQYSPLALAQQHTMLGSRSSVSSGGAGSARHLLQQVCNVQPYASESSRRAGRKMYFQVMKIQPIKCNITLIPSAGCRDYDTNPSRYRMAAALGIQYANISGLPLRIKSLELYDAFLSAPQLTDQIRAHLLSNAVKEMHKVLGQVDILGSPILLGSSLIAGVSSFFYEPARGAMHSPEEFAKGLGKGTVSLLKNSMYGLLGTFGQVTGGFSKGLAALSMDDDYMDRFRSRPLGNRQRVVAGFHNLQAGVKDGVIGLVRDPLVGWQEERGSGLARGLVTGAVGLFVKPMSGALEFASKTASGVGGGIRQLGDEVVRSPAARVREPRIFENLAAHSSMRQCSQWEAALPRLKAGRFKGDRVQDYVQVSNKKAVVFTDRHIICINVRRNKVRWAVMLARYTGYSSQGLMATIHYQVEAGFGGRSLRLPAGHTARCSTREVHDSLLRKLNLSNVRLKASGGAPQRGKGGGGSSAVAAAMPGSPGGSSIAGLGGGGLPGGPAYELGEVATLLEQATAAVGGGSNGGLVFGSFGSTGGGEGREQLQQQQPGSIVGSIGGGGHDSSIQPTHAAQQQQQQLQPSRTLSPPRHVHWGDASTALLPLPGSSSSTHPSSPASTAQAVAAPGGSNSFERSIGASSSAPQLLPATLYPPSGHILGGGGNAAALMPMQRPLAAAAGGGMGGPPASTAASDSTGGCDRPPSSAAGGSDHHFASYAGGGVGGSSSTALLVGGLRGAGGGSRSSLRALALTAGAGSLGIALSERQNSNTSSCNTMSLGRARDRALVQDTMQRLQAIRMLCRTALGPSSSLPPSSSSAGAAPALLPRGLAANLLTSIQVVAASNQAADHGVRPPPAAAPALAAFGTVAALVRGALSQLSMSPGGAGGNGGGGDGGGQGVEQEAPRVVFETVDILCRDALSALGQMGGGGGGSSGDGL